MIRVAVRADGSPRLGSGHLVRCLALAQALRRDGAEVAFICRRDPGSLAGMVAAAGFAVHPLPPQEPFDEQADATATAAVLATGCDWLVVDHYRLGAPWQRTMRRHAGRILVIDDLADRDFDCDLLLNPNLPDDPSRYAGRLPSACRLLLGPRHALLRDEFLAARRGCRPRNGRVARLLVCFGGSDPDGAGLLALEALRRLASAGRLGGLQVEVVAGSANPSMEQLRQATAALPNSRFHAASEQMAALMAAADLAIGGGGGMLWERAFLGLPALVVVLAENQRLASEAAAGQGLVANLGPLRGLDAIAVAAALEALLQAPERLAAMSQRGWALFDGPAFITQPLHWMQE